jgi:hypothetical protein
MKSEKITYLSRDAYSDFPYIKAAKDFIKTNTTYFHGTSWKKTGIKCGYDAAPTYEELMLQVFARQPYWSDYNYYSGNTQRAMDLFRKSDLPYGQLT